MRRNIIAASVAKSEPAADAKCPVVNPTAEVESEKNLVGTLGKAARFQSSPHVSPASSDVVLEGLAMEQTVPEFPSVAQSPPRRKRTLSLTTNITRPQEANDSSFGRDPSV